MNGLHLLLQSNVHLQHISILEALPQKWETALWHITTWSDQSLKILWFDMHILMQVLESYALLMSMSWDQFPSILRGTCARDYKGPYHSMPSKEVFALKLWGDDWHIEAGSTPAERVSYMREDKYLRRISLQCWSLWVWLTHRGMKKPVTYKGYWNGSLMYMLKFGNWEKETEAHPPEVSMTSCKDMQTPWKHGVHVELWRKRRYLNNNPCAHAVLSVIWMVVHPIWRITNIRKLLSKHSAARQPPLQESTAEVWALQGVKLLASPWGAFPDLLRWHDLHHQPCSSLLKQPLHMNTKNQLQSFWRYSVLAMKVWALAADEADFNWARCESLKCALATYQERSVLLHEKELTRLCISMQRATCKGCCPAKSLASLWMMTPCWLQKYPYQNTNLMSGYNTKLWALIVICLRMSSITWALQITAS